MSDFEQSAEYRSLLETLRKATEERRQRVQEWGRQKRREAAKQTEAHWNDATGDYQDGL